jgi:ADP-L-glycero-D-manno-heptose 6-epimerase
MKYNSSKITLITGGAGFIGSAVIRELNNRGITNIVIVDSLGSDDKWKNLVGKSFCDIIHETQLFDWLSDKQASIGGIIHLGACSSTVEVNADYLLDNNYRYTRRLLEFAILHGIRCVYASSAATYGDGSEGFVDTHEGLESLKPLNMYGYSKHLVDLWLLRNNLLDRVVGIKYFNVYGPNEWHKGRMASFVLKMVPEVLKTGKIQLFKSHHPDFQDGEQKRDFIYVKDAAAITCDLLDSTAFGLFNVGTGEAVSWNRLACAVFKALDRSPVIEYMPMPQDLIGKYQYFTQADVSKTEIALNRKLCRYTLEEAVSDYVKAHLLQEIRW